MSETDTPNEFSGSSVEDAIETGLSSLGLTKEEASIEVLEEGVKGLFGLGSKEAVVRITPAGKGASFEEQESGAEGRTVAGAEGRTVAGAERGTVAGAERGTVAGATAPDDPFDEQEEAVAVTRDTVIELLDKMHIHADVRAELAPEDTYSRRTAVLVDILGDDLSILIGRKAETLDALQYITRLIVGKELSSSVIINIDVQGYRKRKEQGLRRTAQSVARQAVETGRRQYLEPMPASDRRIVHMELRDNPDVYTESVGEGHRRKVTINPHN